MSVRSSWTLASWANQTAPTRIPGTAIKQSLHAISGRFNEKFSQITTLSGSRFSSLQVMDLIRCAASTQSNTAVWKAVAEMFLENNPDASVALLRNVSSLNRLEITRFLRDSHIATDIQETITQESATPGRTASDASDMAVARRSTTEISVITPRARLTSSPVSSQSPRSCESLSYGDIADRWKAVPVRRLFEESEVQLESAAGDAGNSYTPLAPVDAPVVTPEAVPDIPLVATAETVPQAQGPDLLTDEAEDGQQAFEHLVPPFEIREAPLGRVVRTSTLQKSNKRLKRSN